MDRGQGDGHGQRDDGDGIGTGGLREEGSSDASPGSDRNVTVQCSACNFQNEVWACPVHGVWSCLCPRAGVAGGRVRAPSSPTAWRCQMCGARSAGGRPIKATPDIADGEPTSSPASIIGPSLPSPRPFMPLAGLQSTLGDSVRSGRTASSSTDTTPDWARAWVKEHPLSPASAAPPLTAEGGTLALRRVTGATSDPASTLPPLTAHEFPVCCLCGLYCDDIFGHNPAPIPAVYFGPDFCRALQDGSRRVIQHVCCSRCNYSHVVPARRASALATTNPTVLSTRNKDASGSSVGAEAATGSEGAQ
jgi:hypothetical protein